VRRGRPPTGSVVRDDESRPIGARITLRDGSRKIIAFKNAPVSEERAKELARTLAKRAIELGMVPVDTDETVSEWSNRWLTERETRGLTSVKDDRSRLKLHVLPTLGHLPMGLVIRDNVEELVEVLDAKVRAKETSWKTARHAWALVTRMFRDAKASKKRDLRVRDDNPTTDVEGPDRGAKKGKQFIFPTELLLLVACERIPLHWRRLFAIATYVGARAGELAALEWEDVDLARGTIHIHRAVDRLHGGTKTTKTGETRRVPLEAELLPLLATMRAESGGAGLVLPFMSNKSEWSKNLRQYLVWAGCDRAELFADDETRKPLTFHDLRSSYATWSAVRGDSPLTIKQRCGHRSFTTTEIYIRLAESFADGFGEPFPELPATALGINSASTDEARRISADFRLPRRYSNAATWKNSAAGWANRDLKPHMGDGEDPREPTKDGVASSDGADAGGLSASRDPKPEQAIDGVELALAKALEAATREGRWDLVGQLARELENRRLLVPAKVVLLRQRG